MKITLATLTEMQEKQFGIEWVIIKKKAKPKEDKEKSKNEVEG
jgi:hypothetical protein